MKEQEMQVLIDGYKKDFFTRTGKNLKIQVVKKWVDICQLPEGFTVDQVVDLYCEYTDWSIDKLKDKCKKEMYVERRQLLAFILWYNGNSLKKIGKLFGQDHTNIIYTLEVLEEQLENSVFSASYLREVMSYIKETHSLNRLNKELVNS